MPDLGQTSRTISGVDKVRKAAPSRTVSPSVGSFQDTVFRMPTQDDAAVPRAPLEVPLPPSQLAHPPCTAEENPYTSAQFQELEPNRSVPDMEADATSDELQVQERRTKSRNNPLRCGRADAVTTPNGEVIGRLKRKKGHLKVYPNERVVRVTSLEEDATQKRNRVAGGSRQSITDFEDDTGDDSSDSDGGAGRDSDGDLGDTPPISLGVPRGKDPVASKSGHELENDRKGNADPPVGRSSASKKGKRGHPPNRKIVPRVTRAAAQKGRQ